MVSRSDNGKYTLRMKTTGLCDDDNPNIFSDLKFPMNEYYSQYQLLEKNFGGLLTEKLLLDYLFFVEKEDPELLRKIPRKKRKELASKVAKEMKSKQALLDSIIQNTNRGEVRDFAISKRIVINSSLWGDSLEVDILNDFDRIEIIPANSTAFFESFLSLSIIENEPYKYLGIIQDKIKRESDCSKLRIRLLTDYYYFVNEYLNEEGKFSKMILKGIMPFRKVKHLSEETKSEIEELYSNIKIKDKRLKPAVRYVMAER
jgi:hypothetical protein